MRYKYGFLFSDSSPRVPGLVLPAENRGPNQRRTRTEKETGHNNQTSCSFLSKEASKARALGAKSSLRT